MSIRARLLPRKWLYAAPVVHGTFCKRYHHYREAHSFSRGTKLLTFRQQCDKLHSRRGYAFKSNLPIKWVRPPYVSCILPQKSGDLEPLPPIDLSQFPSLHEKSKELETANDIVKKLFTLQFKEKRESIRHYRGNLVQKIQKHAHDWGSYEVQIARMTVMIRNLQRHMEEHPHDKRGKVQLKELIDKRNKYLKVLRRCDYKLFEWVLEQLNITCRQPLKMGVRVTRKDSLRKLTAIHCEDIVEGKLKAYREKLESQQIDFLKEKAETLQWIKETEEECEVPFTVSDKDIQEVVEKIQSLEIVRKSGSTDVQNT